MYNTIGERIFCISIKREGVSEAVLFNDKIFTKALANEELISLGQLGYKNLNLVTLTFAINNKLITL